MSTAKVFFILALICFVLAAFGLSFPQVQLVALGLVFFVAGFLAT